MHYIGRTYSIAIKVYFAFIAKYFAHGLFFIVGERRKSNGDNGSDGKKRQAISMKTKVAVIKRLDGGEKMVNVASSYNMTRSTIGTIYKKTELWNM